VEEASTPCRTRRQSILIVGSKLADCVSHQALAASALLRVGHLRIRGRRGDGHRYWLAKSKGLTAGAEPVDGHQEQIFGAKQQALATGQRLRNRGPNEDIAMKRCAQCHGKLGLGVRYRNVWNGRWWVHLRYCSAHCEALHELERYGARAKHGWTRMQTSASSPQN
jgi:hypothetical protein